MINSSKLARELETQLHSLIGKSCWSFVAGEGTGSVVALDFGGKVSRKRPLKNPHLTEEQRRYEGEISLFVESAWRLDSNNAVICGSTDPDRNDGPMVKGLSLVVDRKVDSADILQPAFDLIVKFKGDLCFKIFCDQINLEEKWDNYSLFTKDKIYIVGPRGQISYVSKEFRAVHNRRRFCL